jgi:hypothetical protein
MWPGIMYTLWRLATSWSGRGSNPGGGKIFRTRPYRPCSLPNVLYSGYQAIPEGTAAVAWRLHTRTRRMKRNKNKKFGPSIHDVFGKNT